MYFLYQIRTYLETLNLLKEHWTAKKIVGDSVCLWFDVNFSTLLRYLSDPITVPSQSQHVDHWLLWNGNTHQKVGESCCFSAEGLQMHMWSIRWGSCANRSFALSVWHRFSASEARRSGQTMLRGSVILLTSLVAITRCLYRLKDADGRMWIWNSRQRNNVQTTIPVLINQVLEGRVLCRPEGCHSSDWKSPLYRTYGTDILEKCGRNDSPPRLASNLLLFSRDSVSQTSAADLPLKRHPVGDLQPKDRCTLGASNEWGSKLCLFSHHDVWSFLVWSMSDIIWSTCYQWIFRLKFATRLVSFFPSLQLWTVSLVVPLFGQSGLNWKQGSYSQWTFLFWTELDNWHPERKIAVVKWGQFLHSEFAARWFFSVCLWFAVVQRYRGFWYWIWANHSVYHKYFWTYSTYYMFTWFDMVLVGTIKLQCFFVKFPWFGLAHFSTVSLEVPRPGVAGLCVLLLSAWEPVLCEAWLVVMSSKQRYHALSRKAHFQGGWRW